LTTSHRPKQRIAVGHLNIAAMIPLGSDDDHGSVNRALAGAIHVEQTMNNNGRNAVSNGKTVRDKLKTPPAVYWKIAKLKPHPTQADHWGDLADDRLRELASDIETRGLIHPILIVPDGTIVQGHQRVRACKLLGWIEIPAIVERELAKEGDAAVEEALLLDNYMRGHFDKLTLARASRRMEQLDKRKPREARRAWRRTAEIIGDRSSRTINRHYQVLQTPIEVQRAWQNKQLTLTEACAVDRLRKETQQESALQIRQGGKAKEVVARHISASRKKKEPHSILAVFLKQFGTAVEDFRTVNIDELYKISDTDIAVLAEGKDLIQRLHRQGKKVQRRRPKQQRELQREAKLIKRLRLS